MVRLQVICIQYLKLGTDVMCSVQVNYLGPTKIVKYFVPNFKKMDYVHDLVAGWCETVMRKSQMFEAVFFEHVKFQFIAHFVNITLLALVNLESCFL